MTSLEKARLLDAKDEPVQATEAYEQAIEQSDANLDTFLDLAVLYFTCTDGGYLAVHHLSNEFVRKAGVRMYEVLEHAEDQYDERSEILFWRLYFRWIWGEGEPFLKEAEQLAARGESLVPYFYLFSASNGKKYREEAQHLFDLVKNASTARKRYIKSILESRRKDSEPTIRRPEEFYRG